MLDTVGTALVLHYRWTWYSGTLTGVGIVALLNAAAACLAGRLRDWPSAIMTDPRWLSRTLPLKQHLQTGSWPQVPGALFVLRPQRPMP